MDTPKVSVIMPVYNTEQYVEEAIRSIMQQTLSEIEIIIVDDGSTDNSLEVINKLKNIDNRINIYSQENKGQAEARNNGLSYAKGTYIYFMDSDDVLHTDALETCYNKCLTEDLDFTFFDAEIFSDNNLSLPISYIRKGIIDTAIESGIQSLNYQIDKRVYRVPVWLYFIKKEYLKQSDLNFRAGLKHEDQIFTAKLFVSAKRVAYIPEVFFFRRLRPESIMTGRYTISNVKDYFTVADDLQSFAYDQSKLVNNTVSRTIRFIFDPAIYMANILSLKERLSIAKICIVHYRKYISAKSWLVLLFPWLIKLKSYTK